MSIFSNSIGNFGGWTKPTGGTRRAGTSTGGTRRAGTSTGGTNQAGKAQQSTGNTSQKRIEELDIKAQKALEKWNAAKRDLAKIQQQLQKAKQDYESNPKDANKKARYESLQRQYEAQKIDCEKYHQAWRNAQNEAIYVAQKALDRWNAAKRDLAKIQQQLQKAKQDYESNPKDANKKARYESLQRQYEAQKIDCEKYHQAWHNAQNAAIDARKPKN